ncbi:MAG: exodeoxyribonuclease VII small subunit [Candidatus Eisenbacteria bacterium]
MPKKKMSFEDAMTRIEEIVSDLERGELPLEQSLDRFEEAVKLARSCQQTLGAAQKRISKLVRSEDDGFTLEPLDEPGED